MAWVPPPDYTPLGEVLSGEPLAGQPFIPAPTPPRVANVRLRMPVEKAKNVHIMLLMDRLVFIIVKLIRTKSVLLRASSCSSK